MIPMEAIIPRNPWQYNSFAAQLTRNPASARGNGSKQLWRFFRKTERMARELRA